jgi:hypothetical protein
MIGVVLAPPFHGVQPVLSGAAIKRWCASLTEHGLDAKPDRSDKAGDDDSDDRLESIALHAAKDDEAVAGRLDLVAEDLELRTQPERGDLAFDQAL